MFLNAIESWLQFLAAIAGLATLTIALLAMFASLRRPAGREEGRSRFALRAPLLLAATIAFFGVGVLLWIPLPVELAPWLRRLCAAAGSLLFFGSLALYLWGLRALGRMFAPSSGFGVRLHAAHQLVTAGPFGCIRHPMYLGVIAAGVGLLLLYRTWAALFFAIVMFGLILSVFFGVNPGPNSFLLRASLVKP